MISAGKGKEYKLRFIRMTMNEAQCSYRTGRFFFKVATQNAKFLDSVRSFVKSHRPFHILIDKA